MKFIKTFRIQMNFWGLIFVPSTALRRIIFPVLLIPGEVFHGPDKYVIIIKYAGVLTLSPGDAQAQLEIP